MITVVILNNDEPNVVQLTFENIYHELKDIYGSELLIKDRWFDLEDINNKLVCFVEADCLVSPGYFKKQLEQFKGSGNPRTIGVMSSATAVSYWNNKIYGYAVGMDYIGVRPFREPKSSHPFMVPVAYIPGAIIRLSMLKNCLKSTKLVTTDLVDLSRMICLAFWERSADSGRNGHEVYVNPEVTYLTTENYVNDIHSSDFTIGSEVLNLFNRSMI